MPKLVRPSLLLVIVATAALAPHSARAQQAAAVQPTRFVGTWVGTQAWAIDNPPPGASQDQPVTLELQLVDGKFVGVLKPFLGGEEGATIEEAHITGDSLHATATVGRPRTGARRPGPRDWKDAIRVTFVFTNSGVNLTGTADVKIGDVPWTKFRYELGKKRSRY